MLIAGASVYEKSILVFRGERNFQNVLAYRNCKACGHSVQIIGMLAHDCDFRNDGVAGPFDAKDFGKFLQILRRCFSY